VDNLFGRKNSTTKFKTKTFGLNLWDKFSRKIFSSKIFWRKTYEQNYWIMRKTFGSKNKIIRNKSGKKIW
jgi:hypothetical protein